MNMVVVMFRTQFLFHNLKYSCFLLLYTLVLKI